MSAANGASLQNSWVASSHVASAHFRLSPASGTEHSATHTAGLITLKLIFVTRSMADP